MIRPRLITNLARGGNQLAKPPKAQTGQQGPTTPKRRGGTIATARSELPGFPLTPPATYDTFEEMSKNPTLFLAKTITTAPVRRNNWVWKSKDGTPAKVVDLLKDNLDPLRMAIVRDGLRALEFEAAFFEIIYKRQDGATVVDRFKPLAEYPSTQILTDGGGNVTGLLNKSKTVDGKEGKEVKLNNNECFIYRNEPTVRRPYGFSRYENCLKDYGRSEHIGEKLAQYISKIAGIVVQCHYPDGTGLDANGAARPNFWLAQDVLDAVSAGRSVAFVNKFASFLSGDEKGMITPVAMEKALASAGKSDWVLSAFDPGGTDYTAGFLNTLAYYDKRMFRGWGRGERSGLEADSGGIGTSDAGTHTDTGMLDSELIDQDFCAAFSIGVIDKVAVQNFGPKAAGAVWVEPAPLVDTTVDAAVKLIDIALASPILAPIVSKIVDWEKVGQTASVPLVDDAAGALANAMNAADAAQQNPDAMGQIQNYKRQMDKEILTLLSRRERRDLKLFLTNQRRLLGNNGTLLRGKPCP
jgi:hypothetical protein